MTEGKKNKNKKKDKAVPCFSDLKTQFCAQNAALLLGSQTMSLQLKGFASLNVSRAQKNTPSLLFVENTKHSLSQWLL